jgi:heme exporter protein A
MRLIGAKLRCVRGGREIFAGLDFELRTGEGLLVTGPNGAGKSSLLRLVAGLLRPADGRVALEGAEPDRTTPELAHYLGHLDPLKPSLTVAENLGFWTTFLGGRAGRTVDALAMAGLAELAALPAAYLSAGQRRRLSIARLLAVKRPVWLLDEPTSTLDIAGQASFAALMRAHLADGGLILAATHVPLGLDGARELRLGPPSAPPEERRDG